MSSASTVFAESVNATTARAVAFAIPPEAAARATSADEGSPIGWRTRSRGRAIWRSWLTTSRHSRKRR